MCVMFSELTNYKILFQTKSKVYFLWDWLLFVLVCCGTAISHAAASSAWSLCLVLYVEWVSVCPDCPGVFVLQQCLYFVLQQLPVITSNTIVRCRSCRTYINPFVSFIDQRRWKCNLCYRVNDGESRALRGGLSVSFLTSPSFLQSSFHDIQWRQHRQGSLQSDL